jgi:hypothetical protein
MISSTNPLFTYPSGYTAPKDVDTQIRMLAEIFGLKTAKAIAVAKNLPPRPTRAEGWVAIPRMEVIGEKFFPEVKDLGERYCQGVNLAIKKLESSRSFTNYLQGRILKNCLRGSVNTREKFTILKQYQTEGDFLFLPVQLGAMYKGGTVESVRKNLAPNEFGLGVFAGLCAVLTHPEHFTGDHSLGMNFAGDEFSFEGGSNFSEFVALNCKSGMLHLGPENIDHEYKEKSFGTVTGFLPAEYVTNL